MTHNIEYRTQRSRCTACGARRGFAGALSIDGIPCDPDMCGYCHACGESRWPDNDTSAPRMFVQPSIARAYREPSSIVNADIIAATAAQSSALHKFLINIGGDGMAAHLQQWRVGTDTQGRTLWHYINTNGQHVTTKGMAYSITGKRDANTSPRFGIMMGAEYIDLSSKNGHRPCLFGEHFLNESSAIRDRDGMLHQYAAHTPVFIVESEKSAVLGSFVLPQFIWLACGGTNGITREKSIVLAGRRIIMLFDADDAGIRAMDHNNDRSAANVLISAGAHVVNSIDGAPVQNVVFGGVPDGYDIADHIVSLLMNTHNQNGHVANMKG